MLEEEPAFAVAGEYRMMVNLLRRLLEQFESLYRHITPMFDDASWVGYRLSELLPLPVARKQQLLELEDPVRRLDQLAEVVRTLSSGT